MIQNKEIVYVHEKYKTVLQGIVTQKIDRNYIVFYGGRASSKSTTAGGMLANMFSFCDNYRTIYSRYTASSIEASTKLDFEDGMKMLGINENVYRKKGFMYHNTSCNSLVYLKGLKSNSNEMDGNNKSLKDFNVWICDEAVDIPDVQTFRTIANSFRDKNKKIYIILILNPSHKRHWFYEEFFLPSGIYYDLSYRININYTDVARYLSYDFLREAEEVKRKNLPVYNNVYLGHWRDKVDGVVFYYNVKPFPETDKSISICYGQDFGYADGYNATVMVGIDYRKKILYLKEVIYTNRTGTKTLLQMFEQKIKRQIFIVADSANPQMIHDIRESGYNIRALKKPSVEYSVQKMKDYDIYVDPSSVNLMRELDMYHEKEGVIIQKNNHAIDAARYGFWWLINA